jgi:hypothetical protein
MSYGLVCLRCRKYLFGEGNPRREHAVGCRCDEPVPSHDAQNAARPIPTHDDQGYPLTTGDDRP